MATRRLRSHRLRTRLDMLLTETSREERQAVLTPVQSDVMLAMQEKIWSDKSLTKFVAPPSRRVFTRQSKRKWAATAAKEMRRR